MDFSQAPTQQADYGELIPNGTLAWGWLVVRPFNLDQGIVETPSKSSTARYLDCEITITEGPFMKRKVFTRIGRAGTEKYVNMGNAALRAILEVGQNAGPQNPAGYQIDDDYGQLWDDNRGEGMRVAIKVKVDKGKDGYEDKNDVAAFLSPHPESSHHKDYQRLLKGETGPAAKPAGGPPTNTTPAWGNGGPPAPTTAAPQMAPAPPMAGNDAPPAATPVPPAAQPQTGGKPTWLNS